MGEVAILIASSLILPSTSPSSLPPSHHRPKSSPSPNRRPHPKPLLSDVRRDLTTPPPRHRHHGDPPSTAATRRLLKYYARLASKLALDGRLREFLMIAESVLTSDAVAAEIPQFAARISTRMVAKGICGVLKDGNLDEVLDFLSGVQKLGICPPNLFDESATEALAVECWRIVEERKLDEFVALMETLAGFGFFVKDIVDPIAILKLFVERRDPYTAVRYASIFPHSQLLFCSIIEEFGKKKDMDSAIKVFNAFKQKSGGINMFACRSMIDICGLCGDYLKSRIIFEELLAQKIMPNVYVFNSLMNVNAHDLGYALNVYKQMQNLGVTVDMTSYNILLKACCNARRVDLAQDIYKEIKQKASKGVLKLDVITYSTVIKVFAEAKMWQMALNIKEDMLLADVSPNIVTWSSLISACANAGLLDRAHQIFEEMLMAGCEPSSRCCNIILHACVKSCQFDRAFRFFYTWKETGLKVFHVNKERSYGGRDVCVNEMLLTESTSGIYDSQPSEVAKVVPFKPTIATFNILMKACGTDYYRAKALMDEMKAMGLSPNHISWSVLIDIYGTSQNIKGAIEAFRTMRDVGVKLDVVAYTTTIKACVENKNLAIAFSLFEEMKRYQVQPNWVTYNTLLRARSRYGSLQEVQQCLAIYQDMRKAGYSANDYYLKELLEEWCEGVICSSNQDRALTSLARTYRIPDSKKPYSQLIEKVARHLQKDVGEGQAIDVRGLTKVEARIVVLSVLWKIKEGYRLGKAVQDDMIIISGHELEVHLGIIKVLQNELGLDVITGHGTANTNHASRSLDDASKSAVFEKLNLQKDYRHQARRPQDLGVLKVSRNSLSQWLQKKQGS